MDSEYYAIGLMSGTSLDGLDICYCCLKDAEKSYSYQLISTVTVKYNAVWKEKLATAILLPPNKLDELSVEFARFMIRQIREFIHEQKIEKIDFVASHGHTVHHRPDEGITIQIGDGELMAKELGLKVVNDFRIDDVRLGGQGAPLVPLGDKLLFHEYDACLNLGGIANISFDNAENVRLAFDICPANLPLNKLAEERFKLAYDESGKLAEKGIVLTGLLQELNDLEFYQSNGPKSLGIEWLNQYFYPLINQYSKEKGEDLLATIVEHEAEQIAQIIQQNQLPKILVTGGGAYHNFLIDRIREKTKVNVIVPENQLVDFKEALVFAFLGLLRIKGRINTYSSVTGASKDSSGGKIWNPLK